MIYIKDQKEIDKMKKAGELVALVHDRLKNAIEPGVTTAFLDRIAEDCIREKRGIPSFKGYKPSGSVSGYPGSICISINNEVIHGIPGNRQIIDGDIVSIDVGAILDGFHGDAARTWAVGDVSETAKYLIEVTKESFYVGIKNAVEGNRISDISKAIQDYVEKNGFSVIRQYVGHGIGREMHEPPAIPNYFDGIKGPRLRKGMTLAIEPMVNEGSPDISLLKDGWTVVTKDGKLSAHYENTIVVTNDKPILLT